MQRHLRSSSPTRRTACGLVAATLLLTLGSALAQTPAYPNKPIQLIAQQPPGSQSEAISRIWAECVAKDLGQPVVVINKPGANGVIATSYLKSQPADGYHVMTVGMSQMTITPYVYKNLPYNPYTDFDGVAVLSVSPLILVASAQSGIKKLADIPAVAKSMSGGVNYGSPGKGSPAHLFSADVTSRLQAESTHVPFVGEAAGVTSLLGGQIQLMTLTSGTAGPLINDNKVVPLAIFAAERDPAFANVPTIVETLGAKDLAKPGWLALVTKAGTPPQILKRLGEATERCTADAQYRTKLGAVNVAAVKSTPADVKGWTDSYSAVFKPLIEKLNLVE
jgi:tripartite-type tricarboxylate transporter receptor subunit TctC